MPRGDAPRTLGTLLLSLPVVSDPVSRAISGGARYPTPPDTTDARRDARTVYVREIRASAPDRGRPDGAALPRVARATPGVAILKPRAEVSLGASACFASLGGREGHGRADQWCLVRMSERTASVVSRERIVCLLATQNLFSVDLVYYVFLKRFLFSYAAMLQHFFYAKCIRVQLKRIHGFKISFYT